MTGPTPGTEVSNSSLARQAGEPFTASSISASRLASSFSRALMSRAILFLRRGAVSRCSRWRSAPIMATIWRLRPTRSAKNRVCLSGSGLGSRPVASAKCAMTPASIGSVLARWPIAFAKARTCTGLTTATGSPAAPMAAATTVSNPPVASNATICTESVLNRAASFSTPAALRSTANVSPLGRTTTSRRSFETSIPTMILSMLTRPCLNELRALRPRRLFGFCGLTGGVPCSLTVFNDPGAYELPPVTAKSALSDSHESELQAGGIAVRHLGY
jgi:hypothetical protein